MNKLSRSSKTVIAVTLYMIAVYMVVVHILQWPFYMIFAVYLCTILIAAIVFFSSIIAIYGNYLYAVGKTEKSRKVLLKAISLNTKSPAAYLNYSIMLVREGNGKQALSYLQKSQSLNPKIITDKNIMLTMGSCYWVMGEIENAISILEELRAKYEYVNAKVLTSLGYMYFLNGETEKALEFTNKAIEEDPKCGPAWDNLGQIYYKQGKSQEAREAFLNALEFKDDLVDSYYYLAIMAEESGNMDEARDYLSKARECTISSLNTVTKEQVEQKYKEHMTP